MSRNATRNPQQQRRHKLIGSLEPNGYGRDHARSTRHRFEAFYRQMYPDATRIEWIWTPDTSKPDEDFRNAGIDALIFLPAGHTIAVAEIYREKDFGDMLIEVWADADKRFDGWAIDASRRTKYIAYAVDSAHQAYWIPFRQLQRACTKYLQLWIDRDTTYPHIVENHGRQSWYAAVPWRLVSDALGIEQERMMFPW